MRSALETPVSAYRLESYVWYSASSALMLAGPFCVILILSRMASAPDLGLYAYAYAVTAPVQAFAGLHARAFIAMDRLFGYDIEDVIAQRVYLLAALVFVALALPMLRGTSGRETWVFLGIVVVRLAEGLTDISAGVMQRRHLPRSIALMYACRGIFGLSVFMTLLAYGAPLAVALAGLGSMGLLASLIVDRALLASIGAVPNLRAVCTSLATRRPLRLGLKCLSGAVLVALSLVETNLPRYVVEAFIGISAVGIYTTLGVLLSVATNLVHPVFFMTFAPLGQTAQQRDPESLRILVRMIWTNIGLTIAFSAVLLAACLAFGSSLLSLVFGSEWLRFGNLLAILAVGACASLLRSCLGFALTGLGVFVPQTFITIGSAAIFLALTISSGSQVDVYAIGLTWTAASVLAAAASGVVLGHAMRRHRLAGDSYPAMQTFKFGE
jgi:O-antigen/teichoic acid export membrane protein